MLGTIDGISDGIVSLGGSVVGVGGSGVGGSGVGGSGVGGSGVGGSGVGDSRVGGSGVGGSGVGGSGGSVVGGCPGVGGLGVGGDEAAGGPTDVLIEASAMSSRPQNASSSEKANSRVLLSAYEQPIARTKMSAARNVLISAVGCGKVSQSATLLR